MKKMSLNRKLRQARKGYLLWRRLIQEYSLNEENNHRCAVVLLPRNDEANLYYALGHLDEWLNQNGFSDALLLYVADFPMDLLSLLCSSPCIFRKITDEEYEELIQFELLALQDKRFINTSLVEPEYRNAYIALGKNGINTEELVCYTVYRIFPFVPLKKEMLLMIDSEAVKEFGKKVYNFDAQVTSKADYSKKE